MESQGSHNGFLIRKAPRALLWAGGVLIVAAFFLIARCFGAYILGRFNSPHTLLAVLALLALAVLQGVLSWLAVRNCSACDRRYLLRMAGIFLLIVAVRSFCILYEIDASASYGEALWIALGDQPLIWLFHGAVQGAFVLADWRFRFGKRSVGTA